METIKNIKIDHQIYVDVWNIRKQFIADGWENKPGNLSPYGGSNIKKKIVKFNPILLKVNSVQSKTP